MIDVPVIFNPAARGGRGRPPVERLERAAAECGARLAWWRTEAPGHATELAGKASRQGCCLVAAWGGDGTYNEVARGILDTDTALLALPGGTASVLCYTLGIPRDPVRALLACLDGRVREMAVGRTDRGEVFLLMLSVGPDAVILANLPGWLKRLAGKGGIAVQAALELIRGVPRFEVEIAGARSQASWCVVGNSREYGGNWPVTPGADPFLPGFEVVTLPPAGRVTAARFFLGIRSGRHLGIRGVTRGAAETVTLLGGEGVPYQLDGDAAGFLPVTAHSSRERLLVRVPG